MKRTLALMLAATILTSAPLLVLADDAMSAQTPAQKKMMKDCMAMQKSKDSNMSKDDMKQMCMAKMKADMEKMHSDGQTDSTTPR